MCKYVRTRNFYQIHRFIYRTLMRTESEGKTRGEQTHDKESLKTHFFSEILPSEFKFVFVLTKIEVGELLICV